MIRSLITAAIILFQPTYASGAELALATFQLDVTPPVGAPLCDALCQPAAVVDDSLSARGIVLLPAGQQPIVLLALDWVGIGNSGCDQFRAALAEAAGTTVDRVAVHTLHQHDAPGCDFAAEEIAAAHGLSGKEFNVEFAHDAIRRTAAAVRDAIKAPRPVTHVGAGVGIVEKVASNRRCLGPDGKVKWVRYSSSTDPETIAQPEGIIDPACRCVAFFGGDEPLAVLTYYATHPQSYYCQGHVSADFPGLARSQRDAELPGPLHVHFNGAGGNVAAGKYNDGSPAMRPVLAGRLAAGMRAAWDAVERTPIDDVELQWDTRDVELPPAEHLDESQLLAVLSDAKAPELERLRAVRDLAFLRRCKNGAPITLSRLRLDDVDILHLPGELFVEYQLAAQRLRPDSTVCVAAYGDYGPGYIGLESSYSQGGYETSAIASRVSPRVETVLTQAIAELLK